VNAYRRIHAEALVPTRACWGHDHRMTLVRVPRERGKATRLETRVGDGTKIDNQVQIGHNVTIGTNCLICGKVGISGSVTIGNRVRIGGGAGIADHVKIGTEAAIGAASGVGTDVPAGRYVFGYPAVGIERALEQYRFLGRQKILRRKIKDIEARVEELERGGVSPR